MKGEKCRMAPCESAGSFQGRWLHPINVTSHNTGRGLIEWTLRHCIGHSMQVDLNALTIPKKMNRELTCVCEPLERQVRRLIGKDDSSCAPARDC